MITNYKLFPLPRSHGSIPASSFFININTSVMIITTSNIQKHTYTICHLRCGSIPASSLGFSLSSRSP